MAAKRSKAKSGKAPRRDPLEQLRLICRELPEFAEKVAWGSPTFRVRKKMFGMFVDDHHGDGRVALWCKAPPGAQEILVGAAPARFFVPPYVGHQGWIGIRLDTDDVDWDEIAEHLLESYRMTAPKRVLALLEGSDATAASGEMSAPRKARSARPRRLRAGQ